MHWSDRPEIKAIRSKYYDRHLDVGLKFNKGQLDRLQAIRAVYDVYDDATEEVFAIASPKLMKVWKKTRPTRRKWVDSTTDDFPTATRHLVSWDCFVRQTDFLINSLIVALKEKKHEMP